MHWSFIKFFQLIIEENVYRTVWRICRSVMAQRLLFVAQRLGRGKRRYFLSITRTIKMHSGNICRKGTFSIKFLHFLYIKENDQQRTALSIFRKRNVYLLISIYKPSWQKKSWIFKQNRLIFPGTIDLATNEVILTASYS